MVVPPIEKPAEQPSDKKESDWLSVLQLSRNELSRLATTMQVANNVPGSPMPERREGAERERTAPERVLLESRFLLSPFLYQISMDRQDEKLVAQWKRDIDTLIRQTKEDMQRNDGICRIPELGEHPSEKEIILYNIARYLCAKRNSPGMTGVWHAQAAEKLMRGGPHHVRELGTSFDTCVDTSAVASILAQQYGIEGSVKKPGLEVHYCWQSKTGEIIDVFFLYERGGYAKDAAAFEAKKHPELHIPLLTRNK